MAAIVGVDDVRHNIFWHLTYFSDWSGTTMGMTSHFWSLGVEEQFYLVWPAVLVVFHRRTAVRVLLVLILLSWLSAASIANPINARPAGRVLSGGPLRFIGRISYGIYVIHLFIPTLLRTVGGSAITGMNPFLRAFLYFVITVAFASVSWFAFEGPILRLKKHFEQPVSPQPFAGIV